MSNMVEIVAGIHLYPEGIGKDMFFGRSTMKRNSRQKTGFVLELTKTTHSIINSRASQPQNNKIKTQF